MRHLVFAISLVAVAVSVIAVGRLVLETQRWSGLPRCTGDSLRRVPPNIAALCRQPFSGLVYAGGRTDWVYLRCVPNSEGPTKEDARSDICATVVKMTLGEGLGSLELAGWLSSSLDRLQVYLTRSSGPNNIRLLRGVVRGPGLVNGVPTVYIEITAIPSVNLERATTWSGYLVAAGK